MTEIKLPPLPNEIDLSTPSDERGIYGHTSEQMTAYAILALADLVTRVQELEAAAKLALDAMNKHGSPYLGHIEWYQQGVEALRKAIP